MTDTEPSTPPPPPDPRHDEGVDLVRRRLLKASGRYVAPAILASLLVHQQARGQGASCQPSRCPPVENNCAPLQQCQPGR